MSRSFRSPEPLSTTGRRPYPGTGRVNRWCQETVAELWTNPGLLFRCAQLRRSLHFDAALLSSRNITEGVMVKVFVTGATGVLGSSALRALLADGHDVTGIARSAEK